MVISPLLSEARLFVESPRRSSHQGDQTMFTTQRNRSTDPVRKSTNYHPNPDLLESRALMSRFGLYEAWTPQSYYGQPGTAFADVDGDKRADAIVVNKDRITVRRSTGSGFGAYEAWTPQSYYGQLGTAFADVDGDGKADAIVV